MGALRGSKWRSPSGVEVELTEIGGVGDAAALKTAMNWDSVMQHCPEAELVGCGEGAGDGRTCRQASELSARSAEDFLFQLQ